MVIDSHVHIGKWNFSRLKGISLNLEDFFGIAKKSGIGGAALMPSDQRKNRELAESIRRFSSGKKDMRLWLFYWVNPNDKGDIKELYGNIKHVGGLKVHPTIDRLRFTEPRYKDYIDLADKMRLPILVHCGQWQEIASYKYVLEIAHRYPRTKFILAHMGGPAAQFRLEAAYAIKKMRLKNVFLDMAGTLEFWVLEKCVKEILGAEYYLFGSDYPFMHPSVSIRCVECLDISKKEKDMILSKNFLRLMKERNG